MSRKKNGRNKGKKARGYGSLSGKGGNLAKHRSSGSGSPLQAWVAKEVAKEAEERDREQSRLKENRTELFDSVEDLMKAEGRKR